MKDVTFGVKVPEELRDQINELMKDSGLVGREFMQQLVDAHLLGQSKTQIPEMAEEIKELESLTHRINEMYLYLGTRFKNITAGVEKDKEAIRAEVNKEKEDYEKEKAAYESQLKSAREEVAKLQKEVQEIKAANKDLNMKIEELTGYNANYTELNKQYKNNIEELSKKVEDLKHLKEKNDTLVASNAKLEENNDRLASDLWFSKREIEKLQETLNKDHEKHKNYLAHLKEQHHLERQTALLEMQLDHQKTIEALNDKAANLQEEYNNKLKELLFNTQTKQTEATNHEHTNVTTD